MRSYLHLVAYGALVTLFGCASIDAAPAKLSGTFRRGKYPDAHYLTLRSDGTFLARIFDRSKNGLNTKTPPELITISGSWRVDGTKITLSDFTRPPHIDFVANYSILGHDAVDGLQPLYGAGYIPPFKFVRVPESDIPKTRRA